MNDLNEESMNRKHILIILSILSLAIAPRLMKREAAAKAEMEKSSD